MLQDLETFADHLRQAFIQAGVAMTDTAASVP